MKPAWVYPLRLPLGPGRIKGGSKAVPAVRQGWTSWGAAWHGHQQPRRVTWLQTAARQGESFVMCTYWPPRSHSDTSLLCGQVYLVGQLQAVTSICSLLNGPLGLKKEFRKGLVHSSSALLLAIPTHKPFGCFCSLPWGFFLGGKGGKLQRHP